MTNDPYEALGVKKDATKADINKAYHDQARKVHPDKGGSAEEFQKIKNAAMVLLDPKKRKKFDDTGTLDENRPNNIESVAMEKVCGFFVQSIEAATNQPHINFDELDLVAGARIYFGQQIDACKKAINSIETQISKFEKALKRLKTKRKNDVIRTMITNHMQQRKQLVYLNKTEIEMYTHALVILDDYTFEHADKTAASYNAGMYPSRIFGTF